MISRFVWSAVRALPPDVVRWHLGHVPSCVTHPTRGFIARGVMTILYVPLIAYISCTEALIAVQASADTIRMTPLAVNLFQTWHAEQAAGS